MSKQIVLYCSGQHTASEGVTPGYTTPLSYRDTLEPKHITTKTLDPFRDRFSVFIPSHLCLVVRTIPFSEKDLPNNTQ